VAAVLGAGHAAFSVSWGLGAGWLADTVGEVADRFAGRERLLLVVGAVKLGVAVVPLWLHVRGWPAARRWRPLLWAVAAVLVLWGGVTAIVANLVLAGVIVPAEGFDRPVMEGHA